MSKSQTAHAERVVHQFKDLLSVTGRQHVGEKHFEQLALLIESAIDAAVLDENAKYVSELERIVSRMKRSAEHFDDEPGATQAAIQ
jgi:hypothetical protein